MVFDLEKIKQLVNEIEEKQKELQEEIGQEKKVFVSTDVDISPTRRYKEKRSLVKTTKYHRAKSENRRELREFLRKLLYDKKLGVKEIYKLVKKPYKPLSLHELKCVINKMVLDHKLKMERDNSKKYHPRLYFNYYDDKIEKISEAKKANKKAKKTNDNKLNRDMNIREKIIGVLGDKEMLPQEIHTILVKQYDYRPSINAINVLLTHMFQESEIARYSKDGGLSFIYFNRKDKPSIERARDKPIVKAVEGTYRAGIGQ